MFAETKPIDYPRLKARYLEAVLRGERRVALKLVVEEGLHAGADVGDLHEQVIQESQREIGRLWQENAVSIAQEHQATAISQVVLAHLYDLAPQAPAVGKRVLVACVAGELHDFPARLVADALDLAGFETRYLGADVPTAGLIERIRGDQPDLIALSATMPFNLPSLRAAVAAIRETTEGRIPVAVGGGAFLQGETADTLSVEVMASSAAELVARAKALLGASS